MPAKAKVPAIGKDKLEHFGLSAVAVVAAAPVIGIGFAVLAVGALGLVKELVWDWGLGRGNPDIWDFVADLAGIGLGILLVLAARPASEPEKKKPKRPAREEE